MNRSQQAAGIAIVGPTATGKSDLALALAERYQGEIVNFDSVQIYRHFDIGTAKTGRNERHGIAHHLVNHVEPDRHYSAGDFAKDARQVLDRLRQAGTTAVLVGGTGLYLEALLKGIFRGPNADPAIRARLLESARARPEGHLWKLLAKLDPKAARAIHRRDTHKLVRAIEVTLLGKRPITEQWRDAGEPLRGYRILLLGLDPPREALYRRIDERTRKMFARGLVAEVEGLLERGIPRNARAFGSLGYAQCLRFLDGESSLEDAIESTARQTRRYAKRQMTWFRRRTPDTLWFGSFGDEPEALAWAAEEIASWQDADTEPPQDPDA